MELALTQDYLVQSRRRSQEAGIPPVRSLPRVGDPERMGTALWENTGLSSVASSFHWEILRSVGDTAAAVIVTGTDGVVIDVFSSHGGRSLTEEIGLMVGVNLSEDVAGTNAVGLSLLEKRCVTVHGSDHWLEVLHPFVGAAAPFCTANDQLLGTLAIYTPADRWSPEFVSALSSVAHAIGAQLRKDYLRDSLNWLVMQEWRRFVEGSATHGVVSSEIMASWMRSKSWNVDVDSFALGEEGRVSREELERRRQENALLIEVARPLMEQISLKVSEAGYAVMLTDAEGIVLDMFTTMDEEIRDAYNFHPGYSCHEQYCGTNGWGTPLAAGRAMTVVGAEHYQRIAKEWGCAGSPIRDPEGRIIGSLAVGVPYRSYHSLILGLVISAVDAIEKEFRLRRVTWRMNVLELLRDIHGSLDLEGTLNRVVRGAMFVSEDDFCFVTRLHRREGDRFETEIMAGLPEELMEGESVKDQFVALEPQFVDGAPLVFSRSRLTNLFDAGFVVKHGLQSALVIPLTIQSRVAGSIVLAGRRPRYPNELVEVMALLADQGATAIENALAHERVGEAAMRDALTGLYNRTGLVSRFKMNVSPAPYSLIFVDIDNFKRINDSYGHAVGDEVLTRVAACIQECSRQSDIVARLGGEELVAILPRASLGVAGIVAERMRHAVASLNLYDVTVSIGVANAGEGEADFERVLSLADAELYKAKRSGRNRVLVCEEA